MDYKTGQLDYMDYGLMSTRSLDFETFPKSISTLLRNKSFFKRFANMKNPKNRSLYESLLRRAQVELYQTSQSVFLMDRVGVVTMGAVEVRKHQDNNLLKPYLVKKAIEGDVIGFAEGDGN